ncbi:MAG TPA: PepSY domain-containing protein [Oleiagrimonas sp.]|nr:PepSY domain-containing protein [Oleiagrimonas sp.]
MSKTILATVIAAAFAVPALAQMTPPAAAPATAASAGARTTTLGTVPARKNALSEEAIKTSIAEAGYKMVKGLEFDDGVWRTEARGGNKHWVDLVVDPVTGKVYPEDAPSKLNAEEIQAALVAADYHDVHNVEFEEGLWSADARTAQGFNVDLLVDPDNGNVVAESRD